MEELIIASIPLMISAVVCWLNYRQIEPKWMHFFAWFLLTTFVIQACGYYYSAWFKKSNHFIFNIYTLIEYGFYLLVFYRSVSGSNAKKGVLLALGFFLIIYFFETLVKDHFWTYSSFASNAGRLLVMGCCLLYLGQLLVVERLVHFFLIPMFWIATGIMIAAIGDFLYLAFFDYIVQNKLDPEGKVYGLITTATSVMEYGLFIVGFSIQRIWTKRS